MPLTCLNDSKDDQAPGSSHPSLVVSRVSGKGVVCDRSVEFTEIGHLNSVFELVRRKQMRIPFFMHCREHTFLFCRHAVCNFFNGNI